MKRGLISMFMAFAVLTLTWAPSCAAEPFKVVNAQALKSMLDNDAAVVVIDSRSRAEYDQAHIKGAVSLPLSQMTSDPNSLNFPRISKLVFYCSGSA